jgi:hypothetical protein
VRSISRATHKHILQRTISTTYSTFLPLVKLSNACPNGIPGPITVSRATNRRFARNEVCRIFGKWLKGCIVAGCLMLSGLANAGEVTNATDRSFLLTYSDGTKETVMVHYEPVLDSTVRQLSSASKPLKGKFVDDRRCEWSISARVQARPYLISHSGRLAPLTDLVVVSHNVHHDDRGPDNGLRAAGFYHATCGDKRSTIDGQIDSTRQALVTNFPGIVDTDSGRVTHELESLLKPVKVAHHEKLARR